MVGIPRGGIIRLWSGVSGHFYREVTNVSGHVLEVLKRNFTTLPLPRIDLTSNELILFPELFHGHAQIMPSSATRRTGWCC
jgi:hypothetical protein